MKAKIVFPNGEIIHVDIQALKAISKLFSRFYDLMPEQFDYPKAFREAEMLCEIIECLQFDQAASTDCLDKGQEVQCLPRRTLAH